MESYKCLIVAPGCVILGVVAEQATRFTEEIRSEAISLSGPVCDVRAVADSHQWVASATLEELREWWLREAQHGYEPDTVRERQVLKRWVELDRHNALEVVSRSRRAWGWLAEVIELWAKRDLEDAIRLFSQSQEWRPQLALLIKHVPEKEVDRMLGLLEGFEPEMRLSILSQCAASDARYRVALFRETDEGDFLRDTYLAYWAEQDLQGLLDWAQLPENVSSVREVNFLRVQHEGLGALRDLWEGFDKSERNRAIQMVHVSPEDYEVMSGWAREHLTERSEWNYMKQLLFSAWTQKPGEPERLAEFYEEWVDLGDPLGLIWSPLVSTVQAWAEKDSEGLQAWAMTLPEGAQLPIAKELFRQWLKDDVTSAAPKLLAHFPDLAERGIEGNILFPSPLTHEPFERFVAAVETLPVEYRARQIEMRLKSYGQDLAEIHTLLGMAPEGEAKDRSIQYAVSAMAKEDPEKAATWANGLSDGEAKEFAMRNAMRAFSKKAPEDSAIWI